MSRISNEVLYSEIKNLTKEVEEMKGCYVRKESFNPVRNLVYGFAGLLLTGVITALLALVIK